MVEETFLIVGLGNPGATYGETRHNVGFLVVDALARHQGLSFDSGKWDGLFCRASFWGARIFLLKPQTFMNLSGKTVVRFADFFKIPPDHILVIHDDLDMRPGRLKLVSGGGPGGHNGIRSLIQCLGSKEFFRLKYGIGKPGQQGVHAEIPVEKYVLTPFSQDEKKLLEERLELLVDGIEMFVKSGGQQAMNILNVVK
ncbi:MAG: aminoacyl-tRNA hydrolase [Proteobacteria bacterium]|nr:aminoacyl-tRNA hydrolase [Pseudomonadota bacterium]